MITAGSFLEIFSIFMISLSKKYYQFFLTQAIVFGVGVCCLTLTPITAVSRALPSHRGLAIGIAVSGSSIGGIVWPIMLERLLNNQDLGFGWTMRIVGFTMLPLLTFASVVIRDPPGHVRTGGKKQSTAPSESSASVEEASGGESDTTLTPIAKKKWHASLTPILTNPVFLCLSIGLAVSYLGLFIPFFYIVSFAISPETNGSVSPQFAFYLAAIINASSLFGRTIPGYLADKHLGHFNLLFLAVFFSGVIGFTWTAATSLAGLVVWCLGYGFTSGAILSLQSACAGKIVGPERQGTSLGLLLGVVSVT